jgi:hypothetical protein
MNTFICAFCDGLFKKGRSDEEALAEARQMWQDVPEEKLVEVCEDCHNANIARFN